MPNILTFFLQLHPDFPKHLSVDNMFFQVSTNSLKIPFHRENKVPIFHVFPISDEALLYHNLIGKIQQNITMERININLINIRGLITSNNNKCPYLKSATMTQGNNILLLTETHLYKDNHFDAEINRYFPKHNIIRSDRAISSKPTQDKQLSSGGGCLMITPPHIFSKKILTFSNGNCEILIAECPDLETSFINIYI